MNITQGTDILSLSIIREIGSERSYLSFLAYVNMSQFRKVNNSLLKVQVDVPDMKVKVEWNLDMKVQVQFQSGYKSAV